MTEGEPFRDRGSDEVNTDEREALKAGMAGLERLHLLYARLAGEQDLAAALDAIIAAACEFTETDRGCIQFVGEDGERLEMIAQRGYGPDSPFVAHFRHQGSVAACDQARSHRQRVLIEDVEHHSALQGTQDREVALADGIRATQSTPMFDRQGNLLGVLSTQFRQPHRPTDKQLKLVDMLAWSAADFIERHRTTEALRSSEEWLREVLDSMTEGLAAFGPDFTIREVNAETLRIDGRSREELIGRSHWEAFPGAEASPLGDMYRRVMRDRVPETLYYRYPWPDGRDMWVDVRAYPIADGGMAALWRDVTERKRRELNTALLDDIGKDWSELSLPDEIVEAAGKRLGEFLRASAFTFADIDEERNEATIQHGWNTAGVASLKQTFRLADYLGEEFRRTGRAGETVVVRDTATDERADAEAYARLDLGALVSVPVKQHGRWIANITVMTREARDWRADEIELVREIAARIVPRIQRARVEEALRASEERLRLIIESVRDYAIFTTDTDGCVDRWFPGAQSVFDWTKEEIEGRSADVLFTPEDRDQGVPQDESGTALRDGKAPDIRWHMRKDGCRVLIEGQVVPLTESGKHKGFLKIGQDVTVRRASEAALREREERFRQFGEASSDVLWIVDAETRRLEYLSPAYERIWGRPCAEVVGDLSRWAEAVHPDDREHASTALPQILAGESASRDYRIVRPDGEVRHIVDVGFPIFGDDGRVVRVGGIAQDQTERLRMVQALREREERQQFLLELSDALAPLRDPLEVAEVATAHVCEHLGVSRVYFGEIEGERVTIERDHPRGVPSIVGVHSLKPFGRGFIAAYKPGALIVVDDIEQEPSLKPAARAVLRGEQVAAFTDAVLFEDEGEVSVLAVQSDVPRQWSDAEKSLIRDIAERVRSAIIRARAEAMLRESEERFRSLTEGIPQLVWRAVGYGTWSWASPQWTAFTGQPAEDSLGSGWLDVLHPDDRQSARDAWDQAKETGEFQAAYRLRHHASGEYRWFQTRATPVRDGGKLVEWLGTSTDVQDIKELQERQQLLLAELQHRVRNLLGMMRSLVRQSADRYEDVDEYVAHLIGRIDAMARTQVVLTQAAAGSIDIASLVWGELERIADEDQVTAEGPPTRLSAKAAEILTLAVHELATNSIKYGALGGGGCVAVRWSTAEHEGQRWLELSWREHSDAPAAPTGRRGFGTELIEERVPYELKGRGSIRVTPGGVVAEIAFPLTAANSILAASPGGRDR